MSDCSALMAVPGTAIKLSKSYPWVASGVANLDKQDFVAALKGLSTGKPLFLDTFGILFSLNITANAATDLPYSKIPEAIARAVVRCPVERFNLAGMSWAGMLVQERQGWAPCGSATGLIPMGVTQTVVLWMPFPVQVGLRPADAMFQYDHWWSLDDLMAGEVSIQWSPATIGQAAGLATINAGATSFLQFYGSAVERSDKPNENATSVLRPMVTYWKDYPITSNQMTVPLTSAAIIRHASIYMGNVAMKASNQGTAWTSQQISSGVGRFNMIQDIALSCIDQDRRQNQFQGSSVGGGTRGLYYGDAYQNGLFQCILSHPDSDVTDYNVGDSFDYQSTFSPTISNNPLCIVAWYGDRPANPNGCGDEVIQTPSGATITSEQVKALGPRFVATYANKLPSYSFGGLASPLAKAVGQPAPFNPLAAVS